MSTSRQLLVEQLVRDEGLRLKPYTDTVGKLSLGVGRNLTDNGITQEEAFYLLEHDIDIAVKSLIARYPWVEWMDAPRQAVLVAMTFNLGINRLSGFKQTLGSIQRGDFEAAAVQMLASRWAEQIGDRALRLANQMRTNQWGNP